MQIFRKCLLAVVCLDALSFAQQLSSGVPVENLMDAGHWKRARQIVNARLRANPDDASGLYLASKVEVSFGHVEKGLALAERAVSLAPKNPDFLSQLAEVHARMADRAALLKQVVYVRQFKKDVESALSVNPKHVDTLLVEIMFLSKAPLLAGGDRKRAYTLAQEVTRIDPSWGYLIQARLAEQEKDNQKIERALQHAMEVNPSSYLARYSLAKFYCCVSANRRPDAAIRVAREAIALDPSQSGGYEILARVFARDRKWSALDEVLLEGEAKAPEDLSPYYHAAGTLIEQGVDLQRADRYLRKYLSQEPEGRQPTVSQGRELLAAINGKDGGKVARKAMEAGL